MPAAGFTESEQSKQSDRLPRCSGKLPAGFEGVLQGHGVRIKHPSPAGQPESDTGDVHTFEREVFGDVVTGGFALDVIAEG